MSDDAHEQRLGEARDTHEQAMAPAEQRDHDGFDRGILTDDR